MTEKESAALFAYVYNNGCRIDDHVKQLQSNVRFRRIDSVDCMELMLAIQNAETFHRVTTDILALLNLYGGKKK